MIVVRFESLKDIKGSTYVALSGLDTGWFLAEDVGFGHGSKFSAKKGEPEGGSSLDLFVEKAEKNELTITKPVDVFSPHLMYKAATDRRLKDKKGEFVDVSFLATRSDEKGESGTRAWLKLSFGTCFLIEWKLSGSSSDSIRPTEDLTISYNQVAIGYSRHHTSGSAPTTGQASEIRSVDLMKLGGQASEDDVKWSTGEARVK